MHSIYIYKGLHENESFFLENLKTALIWDLKTVKNDT